MNTVGEDRANVSRDHDNWLKTQVFRKLCLTTRVYHVNSFEPQEHQVL